MTRPSFTVARGAVVAAIVAALMIAAVAVAQAGLRPVIDSAPERVGFRSGATIQGHLDNGVAGSKIALERLQKGAWETLATQATDDQGRVEFTIDGLRTTHDYRLSWTDDSGAARSSDPVTIKVSPKLKWHARPDNVMRGRHIRVRGRLYPNLSGRRVVLQKKTGGQWRSLQTLAVADSRFATRLPAHKVGERRLRVLFRGDERNTQSVTDRIVTVYDPDPATWYGPGFYGHRTACGKRLSEDTLGVAHRSLPCGTKVSILYRGRTITVPVIDRGPYGSADWDLTQETAQRLGFEGSDTIGTEH